MTTVNELVKVRFETPPQGLAAGVPELLWAARVIVHESEYFQIQHSPFYSDAVSYLDVVEAVLIAPNPKVFAYQRTIQKSGRSTFRLVTPPASDIFEMYWQPLARLGCLYDCIATGDKSLCSLDVPAEVNIATAYRLIREGDDAGAWSFEMAHCPHSIKLLN